MSAGVNRSHESSLAYWLWQFMVADTSESIFVPQCLWEQRWREAAGQRQYHNSCFTTGDNAQLFLDWLKEGTLVIVPAIMTLNHVDLLGPKWILNRMRLNLCLFKSAYLHTLCSWNWAFPTCKQIFISIRFFPPYFICITDCPPCLLHTHREIQTRVARWSGWWRASGFRVWVHRGSRLFSRNVLIYNSWRQVLASDCCAAVKLYLRVRHYAERQKVTGGCTTFLDRRQKQHTISVYICSFLYFNFLNKS